MEYSILFINLFAVIASIYILTANLLKKNFSFINLLLSFFAFLTAVMSILLIILNSGVFPDFHPYALRGIFFLPVPAASILFCIALFYPQKKPGQGSTVIFLSFIISVIDYVLVFHAPLFTHSGLLLGEKITLLIQFSILGFYFFAIPALFAFKLRKTPYIRIKHNLAYLLAGFAAAYLLCSAVYAWGHFILQRELTGNPALIIPLLIILFIVHHLIYDMKTSNLSRYYADSFITVILFILLFIPVYLFLHFDEKGVITGEVNFAIKGGLIALFMALFYRGTAGLRERLHNKKYEKLIADVNRILMSVDDLKQFSDTESFWKTLTNDSIKGLKETMGVTGTYFLLPSRRNDAYNFTYGYGPELKPSFFSFDSKLAAFFSSNEEIFEKSYLVTDTAIDAAQEIHDFFNNNNIEIAMSFRSMSGNIIGFLLLGKLASGEPYTADHISAFEIYRIKLQNLLITGLILDEVTAEQVTEHDTLVVDTIKRRIIPEEMPLIEGIRMSSFYINNSPDGGDYFDAVKIARDKISIFISDLSYSGINSALMGLELFSIFHTRSFIFNSPDRVLNMMNQVIKTSRLTGKTAEAACTIISSNGDFLYSNAAFHSMIIYDPDRDEFTEIHSPGPPLGKEMDTRYQLTTGKLRDGSIGLIYSKGLLASCNKSGDFFTLEMAKEVVSKFSRENPAVIARELYSLFNTFTEKRDQLEDISIILFKKVKTENE